jgi:hypothetical protein
LISEIIKNDNKTNHRSFAKAFAKLAQL